MTSFIITIISAVISVVLMLVSMVFAGVWVYNDAKQRGQQAGVWTLLVVLSGNFIGLILYLLIGRKQERGTCGSCGAEINVQGAFCPACGARGNVKNIAVKTNKSLLIACAVCILMAFATFSICIFSVIAADTLTTDGFTFNKQYSLYSSGVNGYAKKVSESSSGDTWSLSFEETSDGYTCKKTYSAASKPVSLSVDVSQCSGSVQLMITQNGTSINETIGEGNYTFDLSGFETGKISMNIINIDASDFSCKLVMETEQ